MRYVDDVFSNISIQQKIAYLSQVTALATDGMNFLFLHGAVARPFIDGVEGRLGPFRYVTGASLM